MLRSREMVQQLRTLEAAFVTASTGLQDPFVGMASTMGACSELNILQEKHSHT